MKLPDSVDLSRATRVQNTTYGGSTISWVSYATGVRADVQPASATQTLRERYGIEDGTLYRVFLKQRSDVKENDRISVSEIGVMRILEIHQWGRHTELWCNTEKAQQQGNIA